jgi:hypothetical protein
MVKGTEKQTMIYKPQHRGDDYVCFVLDQHAELDFYSASSMKQQSVGRHVAPLGHIILIPFQPVFALYLWMYSLTHKYC